MKVGGNGECVRNKEFCAKHSVTFEEKQREREREGGREGEGERDLHKVLQRLVTDITSTDAK
jgi:hypothetical protein